MNIGLLGFGVVGRGVYEITEKRGDMQVKKVLCLEDIQLPDAQAVRDIRAITEDETIDTVVEAMGGLHPAFDFAISQTHFSLPPKRAKTAQFIPSAQAKQEALRTI